MKSGKEIIKHIEQSKKKRKNYESLLEDVRYWFVPDEGSFHSNANYEGHVKNDHLYTTSPTTSAKRLANVLYSTVTPVHEQFFSLSNSNRKEKQTDKQKKWWKEATEKLSAVMAGSNLPKVATNAMKSLVLFGNTTIYPQWMDGKMVYFTYFPENVYLDVDFDGEVDCVTTQKKVSTKQLVAKYGKQCSEKVRERSQNNNTRDDVVVYNYFHKEDGQWKLSIVEEATKHVIKTYNFTSKPFISPAWEKTSYETYGRSLAMDNINNVSTLNKIAKTMLRQAEKVVDPPIAVPYDSSAISKSFASDTGVDGFFEFAVDGNGNSHKPEPLYLGGNLEVGYRQVEEIKKDIDEVFMLDVLTLIMNTGGNVTATQIDSANAEKLDIIVATVNNLISDFVTPLVERTFQILIDEGILGEYPATVNNAGEVDEEMEFTVEVQSSLINKVKQFKALSSMQTIQTVGQLAKLDPTVLDHIDFGQLTEFLLASSSIPSNCIVTGDELEEKQEAKAAAQNEMQQQAMLAEKIKPIDAQKAAEEGSPIDSLEQLIGR